MNRPDAETEGIRLILRGVARPGPDPETEETTFSLILRGVALGVGFWIVGRVLPPVIAAQMIVWRSTPGTLGPWGIP